jgi:hypothetical protein
VIILVLFIFCVVNLLRESCDLLVSTSLVVNVLRESCDLLVSTSFVVSLKPRRFVGMRVFLTHCICVTLLTLVPTNLLLIRGFEWFYQGPCEAFV